MDGLGSTRGLTDETGNVTDTYDYEAFGELVDSSGESENDYLFAGEQFDGGLGQYYLRQRYYDAGVGRFTRRDTYSGSISEPITLHKYIYTHANPVNGIDPTGLFTIAQQAATLVTLNILVVGASAPIYIASTYIEAAVVIAGFLALSAGVTALLEVTTKKDGSKDFKLFPEDRKQRNRIASKQDEPNQFRVQLQYKHQYDHGIAIFGVPEVGVTKRQVYDGLYQLWVTRQGVGWYPLSQDRNLRRGIVEVSEKIKASGPVSQGGEQVATSQWLPDGRQVKRGDYRVDAENIRGTNLQY